MNFSKALGVHSEQLDHQQEAPDVKIMAPDREPQPRAYRRSGITEVERCLGQASWERVNPDFFTLQVFTNDHGASQILILGSQIILLSR